MAAMFRANGTRCEAVWGEMPNRSEVLAAFKNREIDVLSSVMVLTEGWDYPGLECVLLARPTKSRLVLAQQVGRGTRLPEGVNNLLEAEAAGVPLTKRDCLVIDFVDNTSRHSLAGVGSLVGMGDALDFAGKSMVKAARRFEEAVAAKPNLDVMRLKSVDELDLAITQADLFRDVSPPALASFAGMTWNQLSESDFLVSIPGEGSVRVTQDVLGHWTATVTPPVPSPDAPTSTVLLNVEPPDKFDSIEDAIGWSESLLKRAGFGSLLNVKAAWRKNAASEKQLKFLKRLGVFPPAGLTSGEASRAIDAALAARGHR